MKAITASSGAASSASSVPKFLSHVKYEHLIAGIAGGVVSTLVLHPLDLLKIRLAVNDGQKVRPNYQGLVNTITTIAKHEGVKGLYRGVTPNCWGAGISWGFYFLFYNTIKSNMTEGTSTTLGPARHILAAAEAGILTTTITNPIWVVKTRMCLQYGTIAEMQNLPPSKRYSGMVDALRKVYKFEGVPGLYRGYVPGILGVSHGALQFMAYEELKRYYVDKHNLESDGKLGTMAYLTCAALSKLFAASITYPYQVLRARLQDQHSSYNGVIDVIRKTWRFEGIKGYYKGLLPNLIKVTPACALTFVTYEHTINFLLKK
ncbi:mitochondrial folate transporter/carrier-like isoform X2 [Oppia nitens]|uniref:mitochondrial folate transporter/carrier-like isoform X2 n=1 Tax=Oppia nitens TaxID=1686743 RepID=UPI0023D9CE31|nr:mitochondrial folate transporter/carrier-like isoform X2 [Oppia nitens]